MLNTTSKTIFISDLHLSDQQPELTSLFINFINQLNQQHVDKLYILGDFFNYWIGNDNTEAWHQKIIEALHLLSNKTKIYFVAGNRDFLVNQKTAKIFRFELINQDVSNIDVYQQNITILHGDTLCTNDKSYQRFRSFIRNPVIKFLYANLPLKLRLMLAKKAKQKSIANNKAHKNSSEIFDVCEKTVKQVFIEQKSAIMIHGHTHRPKIHQYNINNTASTRYVLGDWHPDGAYYLEVCHHENNNRLDSSGENVEFHFKKFE